MTEATLDPRMLARAFALEEADEPEQVGDFAQSVDLGDNVTDFRFVCLMKGYEGWQWSVTLYHDVDVNEWTVNESTLIPTDKALRPPQWIPWKDRLTAADLSVTDSIGTASDDSRLEDGFRKTQDDTNESHHQSMASSVAPDDSALSLKDGHTIVSDSANDVVNSPADATDATDAKTGKPTEQAQEGVLATKVGTERSYVDSEQLDSVHAQDSPISSSEDTDEAVEAFELSRRHVMSPLGRAQTAQRWYEGPRGPKSLSTKAADGNVCSTCGFFIPLKGDLNVMFGVCANKWSPDDGRVVSVDHGCGEHSEIEPPEPSHIWVQSKPAFDNLHIDVVAQAPREERGEVELMERLSAREPGDSDTPVDAAVSDDTVVSNDVAVSDDTDTSRSAATSNDADTSASTAI